MDLSSVVGKAAISAAPWMKRLWRRFRFGARLETALDWEGVPIYVPGERNPLWRAIQVTITASKDEELVLAGGAVEIRPVGTKLWTKIADLEEFVRVPIEVPRNRQWIHRLSGGTLAKKIREQVDPAAPLELRVVAHDYHNGRTIGDPLTVTVKELERESQR